MHRRLHFEGGSGELRLMKHTRTKAGKPRSRGSRDLAMEKRTRFSRDLAIELKKAASHAMKAHRAAAGLARRPGPAAQRRFEAALPKEMWAALTALQKAGEAAQALRYPLP